MVGEDDITREKKEKKEKEEKDVKPSSSYHATGRYRPPPYRPRQQRCDFMNQKLKNVSIALDTTSPCWNTSDLSDSPPAHIVDVVGSHPSQCIYCYLPVKSHNVDEIVPITQAGRMVDLNRVPCCGACNSSKGNRVDGKFYEWLKNCKKIKHERALAIESYVSTNKKFLQFREDKLRVFNSKRRKLEVMWSEFDTLCTAECNSVLSQEGDAEVYFESA